MTMEKDTAKHVKIVVLGMSFRNAQSTRTVSVGKHVLKGMILIIHLMTVWKSQNQRCPQLFQHIPQKLLNWKPVAKKQLKHHIKEKLKMLPLLPQVILSI